MTIQPIGKRVLVRAYERPTRTPGGIIVPEAWRSVGANEVWECVAVGRRCTEGIGVGDILWAKPWKAVHCGAEVQREIGFDAYIVAEEDVEGRIPWDVSWEEQ